MATTIELYYDVGSPYSWLALEVLLRYRSAWHLDLVLRPVLIGAIHKATGNVPPGAVPAKAALGLQDLMRNAVFFDIPQFRGPPKSFGTRDFSTVRAMRVLTAAAAAEESGQAPTGALLALTRAMYSTIWSAGRGELDIRADDFLRGCCLKAGIVAPLVEELLAAAEAPATKDRLKGTVDAALAHGAFGAPTVVVRGAALPGLPGRAGAAGRDHVFFGSDRFEQMAFLLGKPWRGPNPAGGGQGFPAKL